jgi:hypothetical protein
MNKDVALRGVGSSTQDMLNRFLSSSFIVDYGIIKEIPAEGIVTVMMACATSENNVVVTDCVYANIASSALTVSIKPAVDDKVVVLFPRHFDREMFDPDVKGTLLSESCAGYNLMGGIAVPLSQFHPDAHHNSIVFDGGAFDLETAWDKDSKKNLLSVKGGADGSLEVKSNDIEIDLNKDNSFSVKNGKATVTVDKDGNVTIDAQGKLDFKNQGTSLQKVIDGLATELENLVTTGSPATQTTSPATKTSIGLWRSSKLNALLKS